MAYAQVSDVIAIAPQIDVTASTKPSTAQVQTMITDLERDLNAALTNLGYSTPVTGTVSVQILRDKVAHGVLARVIRSRSYGATNPDDQGAKDADRVYNCFLKALADPHDPMELPDATRTSDQIEKDRLDSNSSFISTIDEADRPTDEYTMSKVF